MSIDRSTKAPGMMTALTVIAACCLLAIPLTVSAPATASLQAAPFAAIVAGDQLGRQPDDRRNPLTPRPVMADSSDQLGRQPDDRRNPLIPRPVMA